jgi:hypothetical protein
MTDTRLILGEPSSYLLFTIFFSLFYFSLFTASFFLFVLPTGGFYQRVLLSYTEGNQRLNHVQQSSTQESPSIVILGAREGKMELLAIWQRGFIGSVLLSAK